MKMINFKVSAPGKVILYGEHAVVYGKTAVAASLDMRTTLEFEELDSDPLNIHLSMPKINFMKKVPLQVINKHFFSDNPKLEDINHEEFYTSVREFVENIGPISSFQKLALEAFFYLFISISKSESVRIEPFKIHVDTKLSISSGLGSSASFAVVLSTCFLHYAHLQKNTGHDAAMLEPSLLETVSSYAQRCEKIMHGAPSGVDNAVCTFGSVIEFRRPDKLQQISGAKKMRILLVDSGVPRSTKAMVEQVAELKRRYPKVFDPILESIDNVSREALDVIKKMKDLPEDPSDDLQEAYNELMTLIEVNQGLLSSCRVSHPTLDGICTEAKKYSLRGKLTGAGGGGYAYIFLLPDTTDETIANVSNELEKQGYKVTITNLGGPGVQVYD